MEFFDSHSHLNDEKFDKDKDETINMLKKEKITRFITCGYDLESSKKAINILGGKIEKIDTFFLADTDMGRNIVSIKKQKGTPNKYPRKAGIPAKEPIK